MAAFQYLEAARADNLIRAYGLATWDCFRLPPSDPRYLPLAEVVRVAQMAGGARHGFRYAAGRSGAGWASPGVAGVAEAAGAVAGVEVASGASAAWAQFPAALAGEGHAGAGN